MKRAAILYFTRRAGVTARGIERALGGEYEVEVCIPKGCLRQTTRALFESADALIFVSACAIAVRAIAPFLAGKQSDPAVLVVDDAGKHVISLLSGHIGGANALAKRVAGAIGAIAVITTATDVNQRFSVDEWASRKGLIIESMEAAKRFSAEILNRDLPLHSDFMIADALPEGLFLAEEGDIGLAIAYRDIHPFDATLRLIPRILHIGVGCKRGTSKEAIRAAIGAALSRGKLSTLALYSLATIDVKNSEAGLIAYCEEARLPVSFYSADELRAVEGEFTASDFVRKTVGVDNVCERAAILSAGLGGELLVGKTAAGGVTVAVAREKWSVSFE